MPASTENELTAIEPDRNCADSNPPSFAVRVLITIAERRKGIDAAHCRLALLHLEAATPLRSSLRGALMLRQLTDLQFAVLVILFSTEPEPLSASVLAEHAAVSRASITNALDELESDRMVTRIWDDLDRRVTHVRITPAGQDKVDLAINDYLHAAANAVGQVPSGEQRTLIKAYLQLLRGAASSDRRERYQIRRAS